MCTTPHFTLEFYLAIESYQVILRVFLPRLKQRGRFDFGTDSVMQVVTKLNICL